MTPPTPPVLLRPEAAGALVGAAAAAGHDTIEHALATAVELGDAAMRPGDGHTHELWSALATLGARDLELARAVEPHLDAMAILHDAGWDAPAIRGIGAVWGVFAAEGPGARLEATRDGDAWRLDGVKPWCSLAGRLEAALVTAWDGDERRLLAVRLDPSSARADDGAWVARGLVRIPSGPVEFAGARAVAVGDPGWYLRRDGFRWGGIGVAACWFGGAVGVARTVLATVRARTSAGELREAHVGAIDEALASARLALDAAAAAVDGGSATGESGALLASRTRGLVARAVEEVLLRTGHALGPAPLALDAVHARRVADLQLYVRQHHAEADQASLGRRLLSAGTPPW